MTITNPRALRIIKYILNKVRLESKGLILSKAMQATNITKRIQESMHNAGTNQKKESKDTGTLILAPGL